MDKLAYNLYDIVEMKKEHPCVSRTRLFQIVRLGADIKIMCLGCGAFIMIPRSVFDKKIVKIIEHKDTQIKL